LLRVFCFVLFCFLVITKQSRVQRDLAMLPLWLEVSSHAFVAWCDVKGTVWSGGSFWRPMVWFSSVLSLKHSCLQSEWGVSSRTQKFLSPWESVLGLCRKRNESM
jgi:hypothetical protein